MFAGLQRRLLQLNPAREQPRSGQKSYPHRRSVWCLAGGAAVGIVRNNVAGVVSPVVKLAWGPWQAQCPLGWENCRCRRRACAL